MSFSIRASLLISLFISFPIQLFAQNSTSSAPIYDDNHNGCLAFAEPITIPRLPSYELLRFYSHTHSYSSDPNEVSPFHLQNEQLPQTHEVCVPSDRFMQIFYEIYPALAESLMKIAESYKRQREGSWSGMSGNLVRLYKNQGAASKSQDNVIETSILTENFMLGFDQKDEWRTLRYLFKLIPITPADYKALTKRLQNREFQELTTTEQFDVLRLGVLWFVKNIHNYYKCERLNSVSSGLVLYKALNKFIDAGLKTSDTNHPEFGNQSSILKDLALAQILLLQIPYTYDQSGTRSKILARWLAVEIMLGATWGYLYDSFT